MFGSKAFRHNFFVVILILALSLASVARGFSEDEDEDPSKEKEEVVESEEEEDEGILASILSSPWSRGKNSIILPILPNLEDKERPSRTESTSDLEEENSSIFQQASSAVLNLANEGLNKIKNNSQGVMRNVSSYIQNIPENLVGKETAAILGNTVTNFHEVAFPAGENTSFIQGMTNLIHEIEATRKELSKWEIEKILLDNAANVFKLNPSTTLRPRTRIQEDNSHGNYYNQKKVWDTDAHNVTTANTAVDTWIIVITVISVLSIAINLVLGYLVVVSRNKVKSVEAELDLYTLEKNQARMEQQKNLLHQVKEMV